MSNTQENRKAEMVKEETITNAEPLPPDIFNRTAIAEQMCQLVVDMKAEDISPLALDGKWGSGKSVHAQRMKECFEKKHQDQVKCIYWNASAEDYSENPLLSFIAFLYQNVDKANRAKFKANSLKVVGTGFKEAFFNVANQIVRHLLCIDVKDGCKAVKSTMEQAEVEGGDIVSAQFGKELDTIASESARLDAAEQLLLSVGGEKELIVIIDELDRCRPDFALKMLESIKHLFSTNNCKFILIMNKDSMACSVNHLYGLGEDESLHYLNKYISRTFQLPNRYQRGFTTTGCDIEYFLYLMGDGAWSNSLVKEFLSHIITSKGMALRDIEKLAATIKFIEKVNNSHIAKTDDFEAFYACYIAYLFSCNHDFAMQIAEKNASQTDILDDLGWYTDPMKGRFTKEKPTYIAYLEPLIDFYIAANTTDKNKALEKHANCRIIKNIERYCHLFNRWMSYCSFMQ